MKICIVGSGNVAYHLAKALVKNDIGEVQIFGRNTESIRTIAQELHLSFSEKIPQDSDLYLIAVSDNAIGEVSKNKFPKESLVAHTSGSLPIEILEGNYRKASFYPLQTFSKDKELDYSKIPFFIEAETDDDVKLLKNIASQISENVLESTYQKRKYIHITAVFACNFVNHLFARSKEISDSQQIPFHFFLPLINETVEKIAFLEPKTAQTGPARRNDGRILKMHEELLHGEHLKIYQTLNESIKKMYEL